MIENTGEGMKPFSFPPVVNFVLSLDLANELQQALELTDWDYERGNVDSDKMRYLNLMLINAIAEVTE